MKLSTALDVINQRRAKTAGGELENNEVGGGVRSRISELVVVHRVVLGLCALVRRHLSGLLQSKVRALVLQELIVPPFPQLRRVRRHPEVVGGGRAHERVREREIALLRFFGQQKSRQPEVVGLESKGGQLACGFVHEAVGRVQRQHARNRVARGRGVPALEWRGDRGALRRYL